MPTIHVLFVCLGNICRSPMAEAVFADKVRAAGLEGVIKADSAGTGSWNLGEPPHVGTTTLLKEKKIDFSHRARKITKGDLSNFDYILTMDEENYRDVSRLGPAKGKVVRFLDYAPELGVRDVPDPWYDGRFHHVYGLIDAAAEGLLKAIRAEHNL